MPPCPGLAWEWGMELQRLLPELGSEGLDCNNPQGPKDLHELLNCAQQSLPGPAWHGWSHAGGRTESLLAGLPCFLNKIPCVEHQHHTWASVLGDAVHFLSSCPLGLGCRAYRHSLFVHFDMGGRGWRKVNTCSLHVGMMHLTYGKCVVK